MGTISMKGHVLILNYPSEEKLLQLLDELHEDTVFTHKEIVLIDEHLEQVTPALLQRGVNYVRGNPARDETLARANVDDATHAIVLSKKASDSHSDDLALAITLAIEARNNDVRTIVECVDTSKEELMRKAGADSVICSSRFEAHFLSNEVLHPGMQDVIEELLTIAGQQLHFVPTKATTFSKAAENARAKGHIAIGVKRNGKSTINVAHETALVEGDQLITIGDKRITEA